jgi:excisionase family DNA binding protein
MRTTGSDPVRTPVETGAAPASTCDWISIREASALLGVSPATLRRWAEAGEIPAFITPGGHRRFSRTALTSRLPQVAPTSRLPQVAPIPPSLARIGETADGVAARYRHRSGGTAAAAPWLGSVPESSRARLRDHGRVIAASLIGSIEATGDAEREAALTAGMAAAGDYGRIAATLGATMRQTVATFLLFRRPFVEEMGAVARRRELDAAGTAALLGASAGAIDRLLDATLEGFEQAMTPRARRGQPARAGADAVAAVGAGAAVDVGGPTR